MTASKSKRRHIYLILSDGEGGHNAICTLCQCQGIPASEGWFTHEDKQNLIKLIYETSDVFCDDFKGESKPFSKMEMDAFLSEAKFGQHTIVDLNTEELNKQLKLSNIF